MKIIHVIISKLNVIIYKFCRKLIDDMIASDCEILYNILRWTYEINQIVIALSILSVTSQNSKSECMSRFAKICCSL